MVVSVNSDIYSPFPHGMIIEDGPQSSEDGSGLHSPIFGAQFPQPHGDSIRYHPDQLDIHNAAGILASQFDNSYLSIPVSHAPPQLLEPSLDLHSTNHHHQPSYPHDYPIPSRSQLGLDISAQPYPNARLPPPPSQGPPININYQPAPLHRRYSNDVARDQSYPSGGPLSPPVSADTDHRSTTQRRHSTSQPAPQQSASGSEDPPPRREAANLVIACRQCRARKIRCDSTRPICHNCVRRSNECQYDAVPKRRGPDKRPGTRQRSCKKRPADGSAPPLPPSKRKRTTGRAPDGQDGVQDRRGIEPPTLRTTGLEQGNHLSLNEPSLSPQESDFSSSAQSRGLSAEAYSMHSDRYLVDKVRMTSTSSVQYNRKEWWDNLVNSYSANPDQSLKDIASDLSTLFTTAGYWLSFVNVSDFLQSLYSPEDRSLMQPSFVLAGLALATLMKSSEMGLGTAGRNRAVWLRDQAQTLLEASWNSQWIDMTLAKAALILAVYESSAHPLYTPERARQSLIHLDHIVRALGLTFLDSNEPEVSTFTPNTVPIAHRRSYDGMSKDSVRSPRSGARKCSCILFPPNASVVTDHFSSSWSYSPPWDPAWTPEEMDKEACRRLCWSALNLVASHTSHCIAFGKEPTDLFLSDPANFRLLFPGEVSERGSNQHKSPSPKDSIWALYCRSMLLWNFCTTRLRKNTFSSAETSELALESWRETQAIQDALDAHTCNLDVTLLYMCREYVYNTQMMITSILQRLHSREAINSPSFNRKHTEQWLLHQSLFIRRVRMSIDRPVEADGDLPTRRPFQVTWFASQVSICISLWEKDRTLVDTLEVAKDIIALLDFLNTLWPCPMLQSKCDELRRKVTGACQSSNIAAPLPHFPLPLHARGG
ncbi:hypothetical protein PAXRUDRAFT_822813 [Paxillus rubicundulus Ve08.2h10]|uniref:Zn(2)-C6 fungal-type domain-containing protein n=1 Tax=Paxillus rubicundulus Ve08.2h10 TaxID=930991 RepID=A0A0D0DLE2_9AGAM|nr:hypothetical protein PAXRUDRAFT_822813 [Paxillus rubicundulus Ve08.2h10]